MTDSTQTTIQPTTDDMKKAAATLRGIAGGHCSFGKVDSLTSAAWERVADWLDKQRTAR